MVARKKVTSSSKIVNGEEYVSVEGTPDMKELRSLVQKIVDDSSWFERYGRAWLEIGLALVLYLVGIRLLAADGTVAWLAAFALISTCHSVIANRGGHLGAHGALCQSRAVNKFLTWLFVEFMGSFSVEVARQAHVREHHPYTNVIGIGDSSSWKIPLLPRGAYMFVAPLFLPLVTPLVAAGQLIKPDGVRSFARRLLALATFCTSAAAGLTTVAALVHRVGGVSPAAALPVVLASRAPFGIPYIHVNVFQHIGLPMWSLEHMPRTLYQMSTGVLNLSRNPLLDWAMGHALISCHVEHHLFPSLSDGMCLKVKPVVRAYLADCGLPYHETTYSERLLHFLRRYDKLMVHAPPITHFVGLQ